MSSLSDLFDGIISYTVYGLIDPQAPSEIRYVGCCLTSRYESGARKKKHLCTKHDPSNQTKNQWIESVKAVGRKPEMVTLELATDVDWEEKERYWIAKIREDGHRLTNLTDGGNGALGLVHSEETKVKQREFRHTEEAKVKIRDALTGRPRTDEHRANLSAAKKGIPLTEKQRTAIAAGKAKNPQCMARYTKGESNGRAILTDDDVREIRKAKGIKSSRLIAIAYGVCQSVVKRIWSGKRWGHVQ